MRDGFAEDFEFFRRAGGIAPRVALELSPAEPSLGQPVRVLVRGLRDGHLVAAGVGRWPVRDGTEVLLRADRVMTLTLANRRGRAVAWARITPQITRPQLLDWQLPSTVPWNQGPLRVAPRTHGSVSTDLAWRADGSPEWQPVPGDGALALQPRAHRVVLRATLRSEHAALAAEATIVAEHSIRVMEPAALAEWVAPARCERHALVWMDLRLQWVVEAQVDMGGGWMGIPVEDVARAGAWRQRLPTEVCGEQEVHLRFRGLDGEWHAQSRTLDVVPRVPSVRLMELGPGRTLMAVRGAQADRLRWPTRGQEWSLATNDVVVEHTAVLPTLAEAVLIDDLGRQCTLAMTFSAARVEWGPLPAMSPLRHEWSDAR